MVPIVTVTLPPTLVGQSNGKLTFTATSPVFFPKWGYLQMEKHAARAWNALALSCHGATGKQLTAVSPADVYRDYDRQVAVFNTRMTRYYNPLTCTLTTRMWDGKKYWLKRGYAAVATPGTSNHGWGLAVDVGVYQPATKTVSALYADKGVWTWLVANALSFGFSWEGANEGQPRFEPWHLRYVNGELVPKKVLELEAFFAGVNGAGGGA